MIPRRFSYYAICRYQTARLKITDSPDGLWSKITIDTQRGAWIQSQVQQTLELLHMGAVIPIPEDQVCRRFPLGWARRVGQWCARSTHGSGSR